MQDRRTATVSAGKDATGNPLPPYRLNVGMVLFNRAGQVLVAKKYNQKDKWAGQWQLPQGGIDEERRALFAKADQNAHFGWLFRNWPLKYLTTWPLIWMRETPSRAFFREVKEELGLVRRDVTIVAKAKRPTQWDFNDGDTKYSGKIVEWFAAVSNPDINIITAYTDYKKKLLDNGKKPEFAEVQWMNMDDLVRAAKDAEVPWAAAYQEVAQQFAAVRVKITSGQTPKPLRGLYTNWLPARWFQPRLSR
jgi:8-oxo-dGTP pyrophosphatase MutT (NUDIX family)